MIRAGATVLVVMMIAGSLRADGGVVRASRKLDGVIVSVMTEPGLVVGLVDVSVLVTDDAGRPRSDVDVDVRAWPTASPERVVRGSATTEAATNKLMRAAHIDCDTAGTWLVEVTAHPPGGPRSVTFAVEVGEPPPSWLTLAPWIVWPIVPLLIFVVREWFRRAGGHGPSRSP